MLRIDELIKKISKEKIEFYKLKDLAEIGTGRSDRKDAIEGGAYPFYVRSKEILRINKYEYDETAIIIPGEGGVGDIFHYANGKYALHQRAYRIHVTNNKLNTKYLYYYMFSKFKNFINQKAVTATVTSIRKPMIEQFEIAVPSLEVQSEIVNILDNLTLYLATLENELILRKKQYEYYAEKIIENQKCENYRLEQLCFFYNGDRGKNYPKVSEMVDEGIPFVNAGDVDGNVDYINCNKITKEKYNSMNGAKLQKNDILYCLRGSTGKNGIYELDEGTIASSLVAIRANEKVNYKYLYYLLNSSMERRQRVMLDTGAAQPNLSVQSIKKYEFPIPEIEKQIKIVEVLDRFDKLCNNLSEGLPAEIEKRQKQYEYYRNLLLNFKEVQYE